MLRQCDYQSIFEIINAQHCIAFVKRHIRAKLFCVHILHKQTIQIRWAAVVRYVGQKSTIIRERKVPVKWMIGKYARRFSCNANRFNQFAVVIGEPREFRIEIDVVMTRFGIGFHHQCIVLRGHVQIHFATRNINNDSYVNVAESWKHGEEDRLTVFQWRWLFALVNCFGIETHLRFHRYLLVALMAVDWIARIRFFALRTL